jgi:hypothetical protein
MVAVAWGRPLSGAFPPLPPSFRITSVERSFLAAVKETLQRRRKERPQRVPFPCGLLQIAIASQ